MDQPRIISGNTLPPDFWDADELIVLQNPRALQPLPSQLPNSGILFATSGSSGQPKWIRHTRASLLASAAAVNQRFHATEQDVWLRALPLFHVGGMGIAARAHLSGAKSDFRRRAMESSANDFAVGNSIRHPLLAGPHSSVRSRFPCPASACFAQGRDRWRWTSAKRSQIAGLGAWLAAAGKLWSD